MLFYQLFDPESSTYTYLIGSSDKQAIIIDPVKSQVNTYLDLINQLGLKLVATLDTHTHADHITGAGVLANLTQCQSMVGMESKASNVTHKFCDHELISCGDLTIKAIHTPGHTPDSYSFLLEDKVFTGDTLLINATGRTDFQGGSASSQYDSLFNKLLKLPETTRVYPGHDYNEKKFSTIKQEKEHNPRLQVKSEEEYTAIMDNLKLAPFENISIIVSANLTNGLNE